MAYFAAHAVAPVGIGCTSCAASVGAAPPVAISGLGAGGDASAVLRNAVIGAGAGALLLWLLAKTMDEQPKKLTVLGAGFGAAIGLFGTI